MRVVLAICALLASASAVHAQEDAALEVARVCYLEATFRRADCAAIVHVAQRRAARVQRPWLDVLKAYSSIRLPAPRPTEVRAFPDGDVSYMAGNWNERWAALRAFARQLVDGQVPNPCPRADHWGGRSLPSDQRRAQRAMTDGRWAPVRCSVPTANDFYRVLGR